MKLYQSNVYKNMTQNLSKVPAVGLADLTADSSVSDACYAYVNSHYVRDMIKAGSPRAAEPYLTIANHMRGVLLPQASERRYAALFKLELAERLSSTTINGILAKLSKLFDALYELDIVKSNPYKGSKRLVSSDKRRKKRCLTDAEISHLLATLDEVTVRSMGRTGVYGDMVRLARETAMRYGEVLNIRGASWNKLQRCVTVEESFSKTRTERRVALSDAAMAILAKYEPADLGGKFFPVGYSALQQQIFKYNRKHGKDIHFHLLRHTAITRYLEKNKSASLMEAQFFSGHASAGGIAPYVHPDTDAMLEKVKNRLNQ